MPGQFNSALQEGKKRRPVDRISFSTASIGSSIEPEVHCIRCIGLEEVLEFNAVVIVDSKLEVNEPQFAPYEF